MPRIVACARCHIIQRIPDVHPKTPLIPARLEWRDGEQYVYKEEDGNAVMVPAFDPVLEDFVNKHGHGLDDNRVIRGELIQVWAVDQKTWDSMDVVTKVKSHLEEVMKENYAEKDEYREEAAKCYNAHGNPDISSGCRDYMDDSKRIGPATYEDDDGNTITVPPEFRHYLCYMCPFQQAAIQVELRRKRGMYNEQEIYRQRAKARKRRANMRPRR
jgi:hypothetical protein